MFSPRREVTFFFLSSLVETSRLRDLPVTPVLERQRQESLQVHWPARLQAQGEALSQEIRELARLLSGQK